jgi:hypothetical protein
MLPALWPGDILTIQRVPLDGLAAGDVIMVSRGRCVVVHRLVTVRDSHLILRGDALAENDPPIQVSAFLGKIFHVQRGQRCTNPAGVGYFRRLAGRALAYSHLLCRLGLRVYIPRNNAQPHIRLSRFASGQWLPSGDHFNAD